jgi:hypothetical protein
MAENVNLSRQHSGGLVLDASCFDYPEASIIGLLAFSPQCIFAAFALAGFPERRQFLSRNYAPVEIRENQRIGGEALGVRKLACALTAIC